MRTLTRLTLALSLVAALVWPALSADQPTDPDHAAKMARGLDLFKKDVRPILVKSCVRCHGGKDTEANFDLTDRERLLKGGESGPAVLPGNGKQSLLYKLIAHQKEPHMPHQAKKLPDDAVARVAAWIDLGAPYDEPLVARTNTGPLWTKKVLAPEAREFWSFQPLRRIEPPAVKNAAWVKTPLDRFVLARQEAAGLTPNPPVDKRQLIRRAYFDLTGLPPSPQEVEAFVKDPSPDAYARLLDRLLESPRYGERWARHWLDLARFAESHGFEHDYDRPGAYHYRDFVIKALNDDMPFTQFVKWQLAGDEYAPEDNEALKATGFLAAGVHSTQITKNEVEKHRYDELDDMVNTTATAFLGLTVGCARCHDHKYDPIPQADYYRLVSAFTTTIRSDIDLNLDPQGYQKAKVAFDREHAPYRDALKSFEARELPGRLARWEATRAGADFPWTTLDVTNPKASDNEVTFTKLEDGSVRAGGKNPKQVVYTFTATTDLAGITALRLEALADPSLVKGGPGRADNGNFALSEIRVTAAPKGGGTATPVKLKSARATFEQKGLPVAAAIDADPKSAWAVDPQFGKDHAAVFEAEAPVGSSGGTVLTVTLAFRNNDKHALGRARLAVTTAPGPQDLTGPGVPAPIPGVLKTPAGKRTEAQKAVLLAWYKTTDAEWQKLHKAEQEHQAKEPKPKTVKALISSEGLKAVRLHTQGEDFLPETHFLRRGDANLKEGVAAPGYLQVLMTSPQKEKRWEVAPPTGWRTSYRRRALAEWLTDPAHGAGHLLARVLVNRLWQHHLGRGIVATPSDFGTRGERPTHPELLDYLATELIRNGWRLKPLHKMILASATYQQGSTQDEAKLSVDRDNKLFWRKPQRRLEAEVIRDSLLAVSGELDLTMYGPGTLDPNVKRRSIYFTVKRSKLMPMMVVFDAPEALGGVAERPTSTIAPQALLLLNNPNVRGQARSFARRVAPSPDTPVEGAVRTAYLSALARTPTAEELAESVAFVRQQAESYRATGKGDGREAALADFCQALLCLNEFVYVD